jgi:RING-type zinc-finger/Helicase conserved C-terminal domain
MIEEIAGEPAGDWKECTICLDAPNMPIITTCRHVFCSDCIDGVFDAPAARGAIENDNEEDVQPLGDVIACPVCRHKLTKADIGKFTPPKEKEKLTPEEAIEEYKKSTTWTKPVDKSDDEESLPDLSAGFLTKRGSTSKTKSGTTSKTKASAPPPKTSKLKLPELIDFGDIGEPDDNEDLFALFSKLPSTKKVKVKKSRAGVTERWRDILEQPEWIPSSKLTALRDQLADWRRDHSNDKIIIFSQFTKALDLVERVCDIEGWASLRYQGDMTLDNRENSLRIFEDDESIPILLTSLKCGGVGLNLTGTLVVD